VIGSIQASALRGRMLAGGARGPAAFAAWRALAAAALVAGCATGGPPPDPASLTYAASLEVDFSRMTETSGGLWVEDLAEGVGRVAAQGTLVRIHYVGYLPDGTVVDSSLGGEPFEFRLGSPDVIRGWNEGIAGMKVGGRRRLVVRPGLAYGSRGQPPQVPPNAVLIFEIQLVDAV
jgi:peptidylprolyl isomerase